MEHTFKSLCVLCQSQNLELSINLYRHPPLLFIKLRTFTNPVSSVWRQSQTEDSLQDGVSVIDKHTRKIIHRYLFYLYSSGAVYPLEKWLPPSNCCWPERVAQLVLISALGLDKPQRAALVFLQYKQAFQVHLQELLLCKAENEKQINR